MVVQAKGFHGELQDMLLRLSEIDGQLITSQPVGGLPDTAKEQLERFMVGGLAPLILRALLVSGGSRSGSSGSGSSSKR